MRVADGPVTPAEEAATLLLLGTVREGVLDVDGGGLLDELGGAADGLVEGVVLGLVGLLLLGDALLLGGKLSLGRGGGFLEVKFGDDARGEEKLKKNL